MQISDLLLAPADLPVLGAHWQPVGFVDLSAVPADACLAPLPCFPLVGLGPALHPAAVALDAVLEPPITADGLLRTVLAAPKAASAAAQLLRSTGDLPPADALQLESMCYAMLQGSSEHADWLASRQPRDARPASGALVVTREGGRLSLVLDRAAARNAIDQAMRDALTEALAVAAADEDVRTVALSARGSVFSIGADLGEFGVTRDPATAHLIRARTLPAHLLWRVAPRLTVHIDGACIGAGLEMAAFGQRVVASRRAWFQLPELLMGIIPGAGGCVSVPRRIGRQRAALLILSGRRISAEVALRWGLVDALVDEAAGDDRRSDAG
jgi:enoyl-CoA hydratase